VSIDQTKEKLMTSKKLRAEGMHLVIDLLEAPAQERTLILRRAIRTVPAVARTAFSNELITDLCQYVDTISDGVRPEILKDLQQRRETIPTPTTKESHQ
jgi:hypothetical protein